MQDFNNNSILSRLDTEVLSEHVVTTNLMGLITMETRQKFDYLAFVLAIVLSVFGISSNIINIIIFHKQGLDNTMNISFFTLAISDVGSLTTMLWSAICVAPPMVNSGIPMDLPTIQYLTSGWPHICFGNITSWITVYITAERCLCIALPLKVKQIITPRVTSAIIIVIYFVNIMSIVPDFIYCYFDWRIIPDRNRTILSLVFRENVQFLEGVSFFSMGILGAVPFPTVIVFTVILVIKLRQQATWREGSTRDSQKAQLTSRRELRTMNMVVLIAVVLIVCYIPGVLVSTTTFIVPSFAVDGTYVNMWFVSWDFAFLIHGVNSSVNIFLYYRLSSNFKKCFYELFDRCIPRDADDLE